MDLLIPGEPPADAADVPPLQFAAFIAMRTDGFPALLGHGEYNRGHVAGGCYEEGEREHTGGGREADVHGTRDRYDEKRDTDGDHHGRVGLMKAAGEQNAPFQTPTEKEKTKKKIKCRDNHKLRPCRFKRRARSKMRECNERQTAFKVTRIVQTGLAQFFHSQSDGITALEPFVIREIESHLPHLLRNMIMTDLRSMIMTDLRKLIMTEVMPRLEQSVSRSFERSPAQLGNRDPDTQQCRGGNSVKKEEMQRLEVGTAVEETQRQGVGGLDVRRLRLSFFNKRLRTPGYTGIPMTAPDDSAIAVWLLDEKSGAAVTTGLEASAGVVIVVLEGDFKPEADTWNAEEFDSAVIRPRPSTPPLILLDQPQFLQNGKLVIKNLILTDNSSHTGSKHFQLGVRMVDDVFRAYVRDAKTEPFAVRDRRGLPYSKHDRPSLHDEVWRLKNIGKGGKFHNKLKSIGVHTVEQFLRLVMRNPALLRKELGSPMHKRMWEELIEHAKTVVLNGKFFIYWAPGCKGRGVLLNNIYQVLGYISSGDIVTPVDKLPEEEKPIYETYKDLAYANPKDIVEHDGTPTFHDVTTGQVMPRPLNITAAGTLPDWVQNSCGRSSLGGTAMQQEQDRMVSATVNDASASFNYGGDAPPRNIDVTMQTEQGSGDYPAGTEGPFGDKTSSIDQGHQVAVYVSSVSTNGIEPVNDQPPLLPQPGPRGNDHFHSPWSPGNGDSHMDEAEPGVPRGYPAEQISDWPCNFPSPRTGLCSDNHAENAHPHHVCGSGNPRGMDCALAGEHPTACRSDYTFPDFDCPFLEQSESDTSSPDPISDCRHEVDPCSILMNGAEEAAFEKATVKMKGGTPEMETSIPMDGTRPESYIIIPNWCNGNSNAGHDDVSPLRNRTPLNGIEDRGAQMGSSLPMTGTPIPANEPPMMDMTGIERPNGELTQLLGCLGDNPAHHDNLNHCLWERSPGQVHAEDTLLGLVHFTNNPDYIQQPGVLQRKRMRCWLQFKTIFLLGFYSKNCKK
ncbi:hypothetical protein CBR_g3 [Chara braunii]|uniref:Uncharacterized protein n=1 Tax=Chara braunii TaxID=69332 RepID=A0A388JLG5_CHABU|nr:hypothetical protein CBR_g3 [Chara braunii]|eukprot:GBG58601.1 hypothetical protein CBR_g3 [Chara braunii]